MQEKNYIYYYFFGNSMSSLTTQDESSVVDRLILFIKKKGWNKKQFSAEVGIHPQNLSKYLSGELDISNLYVKLHSLGCDINWLISGKIADVDRANNSNPTNNIYYFFSESHKEIYVSLKDIYSYRLQGIRNRIGEILEDNYTVENPKFLKEIDYSYISGVRDGVIDITLEFLLLTCETFNTNLLWLVYGFGNTYVSQDKLFNTLTNNIILVGANEELKEKYIRLQAKFEYADETLKNSIRELGDSKRANKDLKKTCTTPH